jgi:hypothetical protein
MNKKKWLPLVAAVLVPTLSHAAYQLCPQNDNVTNPPTIAKSLPCGLPGERTNYSQEWDFTGYFHKNKTDDVWLASLMLNNDNGRINLTVHSAMDDELDISYFNCDLDKKRPITKNINLKLRAGETKQVNIQSSCTKVKAEKMWQDLKPQQKRYWVNLSRSINFVFVGSVMPDTDYNGHNITISENKS